MSSKDKPILFSAPMVRALINGSKTQTRRVITKAPGEGWHMDHVGPTGFQWTCEGGMPRMPYTPPYSVGDRLWVREALRFCAQMDKIKPSKLSQHEPRIYEADNHLYQPACMMIEPGKIRTSMFMPRWASRLTLTVTEVRVQRLRDLAEEDAIAEGIENVRTDDEIGWKNYDPSWPNLTWEVPSASYATLWNSLHGAGEFAKNPWVVAYTFIVKRGNIDQVAA